MYGSIAIPPASSSDRFRALEEAREFEMTDMGRGGSARYPYRLLREPALSTELATRSHATNQKYVDAVTFQPCTSYESRSQDRYCIHDWDLRGGTWQFAAVFDGHAGHATVDYAYQTLPSLVKSSLQSAMSSNVTPMEAVPKVLSDAIRSLDTSITSSLMGLFPGGPNRLEQMSDSQIRQLIHDERAGGKNATSVSRCISGTTVIVTLTDPGKNNVWIANLGDCRAVLCSRSSSGRWKGDQVNPIHNSSNSTELRRVRSEHPRERHCLVDNRVLGYLDPNRAIGDTWLKLPYIFTRRVFSQFDPDWLTAHRVQEYSSQLLTPPYVSNIPDVFHRSLNGSHSGETFLVLCSDGLPDFGQDSRDEQQLVNKWAAVIASSLETARGGRRPNLALALLRDAIGGADTRLVSRNLTVDMDDERHMDDTTILVQTF